MPASCRTHRFGALSRRGVAVLAAGVLSLAAGAAEAMSSRAILARIDTAFDNAVAAPADAQLKAAAWARRNGRLLSAVVCAGDALPALGCGKMAHEAEVIVATVPVGASDREITLADAARELQGQWRGDGYSLTVDSNRAQANVNPDVPFEWRRFVIKRIADDSVVFALGTDIFKARFTGSSVTLTSTSFRGERNLTRY